MTQIQAMLVALNAARIRAIIQKNNRIYLKGFGRDITAYITFDFPDDTQWDTPMGLFGGCSLRVITDAGIGKQDIHRRQDVMHDIGTRLYRAGITSIMPAENPREIFPLPKNNDIAPEDDGDNKTN